MRIGTTRCVSAASGRKSNAFGRGGLSWLHRPCPTSRALPTRRVAIVRGQHKTLNLALQKVAGGVTAWHVTMR